MWCHFSPTLAAKYAARAGDGRQLRYESLSDYEANWAKEQAVLHDADGAEALHKAKCAEVLMLWTHHIPAAKKGELLQVAFPSIPTLKEYSAEHAAHPTAGGVYAEKHSCITGHNNTGRTITNHTFPHWPDEVHYRAYSLARSRSRPRPRPLSTPYRETVNWICSPGVSPSHVHTSPTRARSLHQTAWATELTLSGWDPVAQVGAAPRSRCGGHRARRRKNFTTHLAPSKSVVRKRTGPAIISLSVSNLRRWGTCTPRQVTFAASLSRGRTGAASTMRVSWRGR